MKKLFVFIVSSLLLFTLHAQNPVSWNFSSKKVSDKTFEVHLTADIQSGWHLYSQNQPDDAIAIPTSVKFNNNPLLQPDGKIKEVGKMEKFNDKTLGVSANQYSETVDFVQLVKLKSTAKTNVSGTVQFQTCNDKKCLPPKTVPFNIALK
ncbi:MAG: hypothetical protein C5B54_12320 [Acidobacteria bacterium]|nr:MAG: hypothetical protein C5B54_12320 [Acidobacteriota bacterium]